MPVPFWDDAPDAWDTLSLGGTTMPGLATVQGRVSRKMDTRSRAGADGARVRDRGYEPAHLEIHIKVWTREQLQELTEVLAALHPRNVTPPSSARERRVVRARDRAAREYAEEIHRQNVAIAVEGEAAQDKEELSRLEAAVATERSNVEAERNRPRPRATRTPVDIAHPATDLLGIRRVYVTGIKLPELRRGEFTTTISVLEWTEAPRQAPPPANASQSNASTGSAVEDIQDAFSQSRERARPNADPPARLR